MAMHPTPEPDRWQELAALPKRSPDLDAELHTWLQHHPELLQAHREEQSLTRLLGTLRRPVPSSNFTSRVLQEIRRPAPIAPLPWFARLPRLSWLRASAYASFVVGSSWLALHQYQQHQRHDLALTVASVAHVANLLPTANPSAAPDLDLLRDFDVIHRLSSAPVPDVELLTGLK